MNDIKILFTDLDWTIINHNNGPHFDMESIEAFKKAQSKGVKVFICTARSPHTISQVGLLDAFTPDGIIACNGGVVFYRDEVIFQDTIPNDEFVSLCELMNKHNINVEGIESNHYFMINNNRTNIEKTFSVFIEKVPEVEDYHNRNVIAGMLFASEEEMKDIELPSNLHFYRFYDLAMDFSKKEHFKGDAIKEVLKYFNLSKDNAMAFGDDIQDISMFNEVTYGVAMGNGKEEVKQASYFVTKEVWNSGVKYALEYFKVI